MQRLDVLSCPGRFIEYVCRRQPFRPFVYVHNANVRAFGLNSDSTVRTAAREHAESSTASRIRMPPEGCKTRTSIVRRFLCTYGGCTSTFPIRLPEIRQVASVRKTEASMTAVTSTATHEQRPKVVVMVASAGGIQALLTVLSNLPATFPAPIVVVQHRTPDHKSLLSRVLSRRTPLRVIDAEENDILQAGTVYVARADRHLTITPEQQVRYSDGHRIRHVLSSANPMFKSAAESFGPGTIGVVLTGTDGDGTDGVQAIKNYGGIVIAQDRRTSQHFGMPQSAITTGAVDYVLPIDEIAPVLQRLTS